VVKTAVGRKPLRLDQLGEDFTGTGVTPRLTKHGVSERRTGGEIVKAPAAVR